METATEKATLTWWGGGWGVEIITGTFTDGVATDLLLFVDKMDLVS